MPFVATATHATWAFWLTTLVGGLWVGVACADPPDREARSGAGVVPVQEESGRTSTDELGEYIEQIERHLDWMHRRAE